MNSEFPMYAMAVGTAGNTASVTCQLSFELFSNELKLRMRISNHGQTPIYILNRLWTLDPSSRLIPDPERIYRFVSDDTLRLFLGSAPLPRSKTPLYKNVPYAILVQARDTFAADIVIAVPIKEYNVYFPEQKNSSYQSVRVNHLELLIQYIEASPNVEAGPVQLDGPALQIVTPAAWDTAKTLRSDTVSVSLEAMRRTDEFERLILPGEKRDTTRPK